MAASASPISRAWLTVWMASCRRSGPVIKSDPSANGHGPSSAVARHTRASRATVARAWQADMASTRLGQVRPPGGPSTMLRKYLNRKNDQGISPVIGTILMIAATVIIAGAVYAAVNIYGGKNAKQTVDAAWKSQALD